MIILFLQVAGESRFRRSYSTEVGLQEQNSNARFEFAPYLYI